MGKDHLVVVIHETAPPQVVLVFKVDAGEIHTLYRVGVDVGLGEHHVLAEGDVGPGFRDLKVVGERDSGPDQQVTEDTFDPALVAEKIERLCLLLTGVIPDDCRAEAVDGSECEPFRAFFSEKAHKPRPHIPGGGHGVGHSQDALRRDGAAVDHVPQSGHQHRGLSAPGHRQQQDRALRLPHRRLLLGIEPDRISSFKFLVCHRNTPFPVRRKGRTWKLTITNR